MRKREVDKMPSESFVSISNVKPHVAINKNRLKTDYDFNNVSFKSAIANLSEAQKIFEKAVGDLFKAYLELNAKNMDEKANDQLAKNLVSNLSEILSKTQFESIVNGVNEKFNEIKKKLDSELNTIAEEVEKHYPFLDNKHKIIDAVAFKAKMLKDVQTAFKEISKASEDISKKIAQNKESAANDAIENSLSSFREIAAKRVKKLESSIDKIAYSLHYSHTAIVSSGVATKDIANLMTSISKISTPATISSKQASSADGDEFNDSTEKSDSLLTDTLTSSLLTKKNVNKLFEAINIAYVEAVRNWNQDNTSYDRMKRKDERDNEERIRKDFYSSLKTLFFPFAVAQMLAFPFKLIKKAKRLVGVLGIWITTQMGWLWTAIVNIVTFRFQLYKNTFKLMLVPIKRITGMALRFGVFLTKKVVGGVLFTIKKTASLVSSLLLNKTTFNAIVRFFATPFGAYILGFAIGKIYMFGKWAFSGIKDYFEKVREFYVASREKFIEWFSQTVVGKAIDSIYPDIEKLMDVFENAKLSDALKLADAILDTDILNVVEEFGLSLGDTLTQFIGGALGGLAGGLIGGLVGSLAGPYGAAIGAAAGSFLGGSVGSWFGAQVFHGFTGYFKERDEQNRIDNLKNELAGINYGVSITKSLSEQHRKSSDVLDNLTKRLLKSGAEKNIRALDIIGSAKKADTRIHSEGGFYSSSSNKFKTHNKDVGYDLEGKINYIRQNIDSEILEAKTKLDNNIERHEAEKIYNDSKLPYDFYNFSLKANDLFNDNGETVRSHHPYRYRYFRAKMVQSLLMSYDEGKITSSQFIDLYNKITRIESSKDALWNTFAMQGFYAIDRYTFLDLLKLNKDTNIGDKGEFVPVIKIKDRDRKENLSRIISRGDALKEIVNNNVANQTSQIRQTYYAMLDKINKMLPDNEIFLNRAESNLLNLLNYLSVEYNGPEDLKEKSIIEDFNAVAPLYIANLLEKDLNDNGSLDIEEFVASLAEEQGPSEDYAAFKEEVSKLTEGIDASSEDAIYRMNNKFNEIYGDFFEGTEPLQPSNTENLNAVIDNVTESLKKVQTFFDTSTKEDYKRYILSAASYISSWVDGPLHYSYLFGNLNMDNLFKGGNPAALDAGGSD